ncbi:MAG: uroporphyrinogen-III synthase [Chloroflexi bacterium]|nr:MAG: uroporphyrinogen-III synthase [Chloroflexota bacterium]
MTDLTGKRILVTRPKSQSAALIEKLASLGAVPIAFATIEISAPEDTQLLDQAIASLNAYQWVIFTSVNGVSAFWQRLGALGKGSEVFDQTRVAAIGPATAQALAERGVQPGFVPDEYVAEAILPGLGDVRGKRILLPRADIARKALVEALLQQGAFPEEIAVYRTLPARPTPETLAELEKGVDIATFTSSSTVRNFFELLGDQAAERLKGAVIACIGPITAGTARSLGLSVDIIAEVYTADGLVDALCGYEKYH